jgi:dTDP-4-amino-4,6-dideoxygalactose transaminase
VGSYWKGKHAGTYGDVGVFSFQQGKQIPTGDGGMITTNREDLHYKLYHEWAFGGESPAFMTLNFRMNEVTAAIGRAQLDRVDGYLEEYNRNNAMLDEAISDCSWLRNRSIPDDATPVGYNWCCLWEGDREGLDFEEFKKVCRQEGANLKFEFTQKPAYYYDVFKVSTAYHQPDCPIRCPYYESDFRYAEGLCPVAEDLIWRTVRSKVMERSEDEMKDAVDKIRKAIGLMG